MAVYLQELAQTREMLDSRYDDIKSGRVKPIDGEAFFESLRLREEELLNPRSPKGTSSRASISILARPRTSRKSANSSRKTVSWQRGASAWIHSTPFVTSQRF